MRPQETEPNRRTQFREASPRLKLAAALVIVTATALLPRRLEFIYLVPVAGLLVLWPLCRMPLRYVARRMLVAEPFILGIALLSLLSPEATPIVLSAIIKSNVCIFTMLLLTWTTPFPEILEALRRWRAPSVMLTTLALMVRYLPVLAEESQRMQRARASRTFSRRRGAAWRNFAAIIGQLFIRSADRAERIYLAMCARGWK